MRAALHEAQLAVTSIYAGAREKGVSSCTSERMNSETLFLEQSYVPNVLTFSPCLAPFSRPYFFSFALLNLHRRRAFFLFWGGRVKEDGSVEKGGDKLDILRANHDDTAIIGRGGNL